MKPGVNQLRAGKYRADIDGLRAVAILSVIVFHAFPGWAPGGFVGVDVFFVVSGYLISGIIFEKLRLNSFSYVEFYARRINRIFPALLCVLTFLLIYGWATMLPFEYAKLGKHIFGGAVFLSNFIFWGESGYFDVEAAQKPLLHLWSLGIEEQFYIFWPLLLVFTWRWRKDQFIRVTVVAALGSFAISIISVHYSQVAAFYSPASRIWEMLLGGLVAYVFACRSNAHLTAAKRNIYSAIGLALVFLSVGIVSKSNFPGWMALLPTIGTSLIILAGPDAWLNRTLLGQRGLVALGLISYPLYLWHWPALHLANSFYFESPMYIRFVRILAIGASVAIAYLTFRYIESPIRRLGPSAATYWLAAAMTTIALGGGFVFASDGIASRFPTYLQSIGKEPIQAAWREHECFLQPGDSFSANCGKGSLSKKFLLLWGDSHAAALYSGFQELGERHNLEIGQYTVSACAPLADQRGPNGAYCNEQNQKILQVVQKLRPHAVILHANWSSETNNKYNVDASRLSSVVDSLKRNGVNIIFLIGPVPQWKPSLPKALWRCYAKSPIPEYTQCGLNPSIAELDLRMEVIARSLNIRYISAYREMCRSDGCAAKIGPSIVTTDYGHLTPPASNFLIERLGHNFLQ